jgi:hypothetical protein
MTTRQLYTDGQTTDIVEVQPETAVVIAGPGYIDPGRVRCQITNTGNGYIAHFPAHRSTEQDYYVCLDYAQARDLILGLSAFKEELGFRGE